MSVAAVDVASIRRHLQRQHAYGSDRFRDMIEAMLGRSVGPQKIGRPRKEKDSPARRLVPESGSLGLTGT